MYCTVKEIIREVLDTDVPDSECVFAVVLGAFVRHQLRHCRAADAGSQPPAVPGGRQSGTSGAGRLPAGCYSGA
ncbi:putative DNA methylase [Escherichia coli]|nr:putative DNA methylase [Escherichia coli]